MHTERLLKLTEQRDTQAAIELIREAKKQHELDWVVLACEAIVNSEPYDLDFIRDQIRWTLDRVGRLQHSVKAFAKKHGKDWFDKIWEITEPANQQGEITPPHKYSHCWEHGSDSRSITIHPDRAQWFAYIHRDQTIDGGPNEPPLPTYLRDVSLLRRLGHLVINISHHSQPPSINAYVCYHCDAQGAVEKKTGFTRYPTECTHITEKHFSLPYESPHRTHALVMFNDMLKVLWGDWWWDFWKIHAPQPRLGWVSKRYNPDTWNRMVRLGNQGVYHGKEWMQDSRDLAKIWKNGRIEAGALCPYLPIEFLESGKYDDLPEYPR